MTAVDCGAKVLYGRAPAVATCLLSRLSAEISPATKARRTNFRKKKEICLIMSLMSIDDVDENT